MLTIEYNEKLIMLSLHKPFRIPIVCRLSPTVVGFWRGYMPKEPYKNADFAQALDWKESTAGGYFGGWRGGTDSVAPLEGPN